MTGPIDPQLRPTVAGGARLQPGAEPVVGVIYNPRSHRNQGRDLVGVGTAGADGAFRVPFTGLPARGHITATHTDLQGNTSPFAVAPNLPGRAPLNTLVLPAVLLVAGAAAVRGFQSDSPE